jgi:hypothetical protein
MAGHRQALDRDERFLYYEAPFHQTAYHEIQLWGDRYTEFCPGVLSLPLDTGCSTASVGGASRSTSTGAPPHMSSVVYYHDQAYGRRRTFVVHMEHGIKLSFLTF